MSLKRTLVVKLPRVVGAAAVGLLFLGLGGVLVCSTYPTYKDLPTDCTVVNGYDLNSTDTDAGQQNLALDNFTNWFAAADYTPVTPDAGTNAAVSANDDAASKFIASAQLTVADPIPDGPVCGNTKAVVLRASHNNDWGCLFGPWDFGKTPQDASGWEGIAFWARAPGNTTKAFTISLSDTNTEADSNAGVCRNYIADGGAPSGPGGPSGIDPQTGTPLSGSGTTRAPYPDECGNGYTLAMQVTSDWRFYTVPFGDLEQASNPNRVPNSVFQAGTVAENGLLTSGLRHLVFRMSKEAEVELWLAHPAFYRKKAQ
jgi:hypothetical protein